MGFLTPTLPPVDMEEWKKQPHLERIKPLAQDWAINGFGTPTAVYLLYVVKLVVFSLGGFLLISATTPGIGGLGDIGGWWTQPIVFQKLVVWLVLWEIIGLGCGSMPLTFRFAPMIGGSLYWLRPGTVRLPPWPRTIPLTRGTRRSIVDVALYAGVLASALYLLLADRLDDGAIVVLLALLALLGLRDKVAFLAARPEIYVPFLVIFLFPASNFVVAAQFVFLCIWIGAAASKLNRHFPFVVSAMISNTPWNRWRRAKAMLYEDHPEDLRPSRHAAFAAHTGTVIEFVLPILLIVTSKGPLGTVAVVGMILFHIHITSTFPLAVPLEWNLFMIFGIIFLFGHYGDVPLSTLEDPLLIALLIVSSVLIPIAGNFRPDKFSFLPAMRYYAGNWATSQWLFRKDTGAEEKLDDGSITKPAPAVVEQLTRFYGRETAELLLAKGLAFRSMHSHGRALNGLVVRAVEDLEAYHVREGELISGIVNGWNFGDGHLHSAQLLEAVQERCGFEAGELRVVTLESQPAHVQRQHYRIYDAATGLIEEGDIRVADLLARQPWLDATGVFPVESISCAQAPPLSAPSRP
ncbi:MAG: DUF3556 domain-containing protein [Thermoleophilaceae bacterium]|nr:DUF3556 domain-containing protein [Thermoleophilaceae bacterium]